MQKQDGSHLIGMFAVDVNWGTSVYSITYISEVTGSIPGPIPAILDFYIKGPTATRSKDVGFVSSSTTRNTSQYRSLEAVLEVYPDDPTVIKLLEYLA